MKPPWIHGEWAGLIALVLAIGVSLSLVIDITIVALNGTSEANSNLLSTLFGASIGVVGTYIGAHGRHGQRSTDRRGEDEQLRPPDAG